jgi:4-hydroxy-tetrahydrodipicolinate reductase
MSSSPIKICVAGCTGWTGSAVTRGVLAANDMRLTGAVARKAAGEDVGSVVGLNPAGLKVVATFEEAIGQHCDVLIDYTKPDSVKARVLHALNNKIRVVVGTSGLTANDYKEIDEAARKNNVGVVAAGNFSITAAVAKQCALLAARHAPSWEIIDYAEPHKPDAPSGTTRELAERMAEISKNHLDVPIEKILGQKEARGGTVAGTQMHSVRLPGYKFGFEVLFGLPDERITIKHDSSPSAEPYVAGTLLAARKAMTITGLVRGMDTILFGD